jgi:[ribosomal protein S18]-alanine N-acetyltransferase
MPEAVIASPHTEVSISRMTEHDLLEVVEIEETSKLSPWGWEAYHMELQCQSTSLMLVARGSADSGLIGFIVARDLANEIHINNVAVRPEFRGRGVGRRLLREVLAWGRQRGARQAVLEVRAGNEAAQQLYHRCGFEVIGRRRRYYRSPVEDALLMSVSLHQNP